MRTDARPTADVKNARAATVRGAPSLATLDRTPPVARAMRVRSAAMARARVVRAVTAMRVRSDVRKNADRGRIGTATDARLVTATGRRRSVRSPVPTRGPRAAMPVSALIVETLRVRGRPARAVTPVRSVVMVRTRVVRVVRVTCVRSVVMVRTRVVRVARVTCVRSVVMVRTRVVRVARAMRVRSVVMVTARVVRVARAMRVRSPATTPAIVAAPVTVALDGSARTTDAPLVRRRTSASAGRSCPTRSRLATCPAGRATS